VQQEIEKVINGYFERGEPDDRVLDLQTVLALLSEEGNETILRYPPPDFDLKAMLMEMKVAEPFSEFARKQNEELEKLIHQNHPTHVMGQIMWCRAAQIVVEESICNPDELTINSKQWTSNTRELYLLITRSSSFIRDLQLFFSTTALTSYQTTIGAELMINVYKKVIEAATATVASREASSPLNLNVKEMPIEGLAKVRHVGAWAVKQVLNQKSKYAKENLFSLNQKTYESACDCHEMCVLFQDHIVDNFSNLEKTSKYPGTLLVTEERQFRGRGLTHICDEAYVFFLDLEALRIELLNENKLRNLKEDTINSAMEAFEKSTALLSKWCLCFPLAVVQHNQVESLYNVKRKEN